MGSTSSLGLNNFLGCSEICCTYLSVSPTPGLSNGDNFSIIICIIHILRQEHGLLGIFSRMKQEMHVEYSTMCGIRGHFKELKFF